jgi:excisionase family DNA binding protein
MSGLRIDLDDDALDALADRIADRLADRIVPTTSTPPVAYTPTTLAAELGITARAVRAAIERGDLQARRSGRGYVIGAEAVAAWASSSARARRRAAPRAPRTLRDALAGLDREEYHGGNK